jgi:hypothetical protein
VRINALVVVAHYSIICWFSVGVVSFSIGVVSIFYFV